MADWVIGCQPTLLLPTSSRLPIELLSSSSSSRKHFCLDGIRLQPTILSASSADSPQTTILRKRRIRQALQFKMTSSNDETRSKMFKIMVLQGDHIGPEIMAEVLPLFNLIETRFDIKIETVEQLIGGACLDTHDCPIQESTLQEALGCHAVLLASVGGPKWDVGDSSRRPETGILRMRKHLNLYANVRPAKIISQRQLRLSSLKEDVVRGVSIITLRENAGGIYFGKKQEPDEHALRGKYAARSDLRLKPGPSMFNKRDFKSPPGIRLGHSVLTYPQI